MLEYNKISFTNEAHFATLFFSLLMILLLLFLVPVNALVAAEGPAAHVQEGHPVVGDGHAALALQ